MTETELLNEYRKRMTLKVESYISLLKNTYSENPDRIHEQIAHYSSKLNNTADDTIAEIFNDQNINIKELIHVDPTLYYSYSLLVRKSWVIKIKISKKFDDYCKKMINNI